MATRNQAAEDAVSTFNSIIPGLQSQADQIYQAYRDALDQSGCAAEGGAMPLHFVSMESDVDQTVAHLVAQGDTASLEFMLESGNFPAHEAVIREGIRKIAAKVAAEAAKAAAEKALAQRMAASAERVIAREMQGKIMREFPSQFLKKSLTEIKELAQKGDKAAQKAWKLLNDSRFKKPNITPPRGTGPSPSGS